jgi:hypothetical protein
VGIILAMVLAGSCLASAAKEKKKETLPAYVLYARTVLVMVDPDVGISMADPTGNRQAQENVEKALMDWGRLRLVLEHMAPDLIIVVRKGTGKEAQPTVGGIPPNDRPVILEPRDGGIRIGGQTGGPAGTVPGDPNAGRPTQGVAVGAAEDMFSVYRGDLGIQTAPLWRYVAKDCLKSPSVPAVKEFKKAVDEAVKLQQQQQKQKQQPPPQGSRP